MFGGSRLWNEGDRESYEYEGLCREHYGVTHSEITAHSETPSLVV